jgi:transcriptional regulator with XRE-family HTH domain
MDDATIERLYFELGREVRWHRKRNRMKQQALADAVGLSRTSIANIESGRQHTTLHMLMRLCEKLNVSAGDLLVDVPTLGYTGEGETH